MKKTLFIITVISVIFMSSISLLSKNNEPKNTIVDAKTAHYTNMTELENDSPIIVKGKKIREDEPTILKSNQGDHIVATYTLSTFKIDEIFKNDSSSILEPGQEIAIYENEAYDKNTNIIYHIAGYSKMELDNEYILFMHYSEYDGWYVPTANTFGKIPLDPTEKVLYEEPVVSRSSVYEEPIQEIIADEVRQNFK